MRKKMDEEREKEFKCHDFRFNDLMSSRLNDHFIVPNFFGHYSL